MSDIIKPEDWISSAKRFAPPPRSLEPPIDDLVSHVVGKKVYTTDPRLLNLVIKWKKQAGKSDISTQPDNYFRDPKKVAELRKAFGSPL